MSFPESIVESPVISPAARRLRNAISAAGASAAPDPFDAARIVVRARRGGVTLTVASASVEAARELVDAGLCSWSQEEGGARLILAGPRATGDHETSGALEASRPRPEPRCDAGAPARLVDAAESPIAWLARRRGREGAAFLDTAQFQAGERLRRDLELARILPKVTQSWEQPTGGAGKPGEATDVSIAAGQRARRALDVVGGEMAGLLLDVCGFLKGLGTVEAERGWPKRSGKIVLRMALDRLAAHYGLAVEARGPARAPLRAWCETTPPPPRA